MFALQRTKEVLGYILILLDLDRWGQGKGKMKSVDKLMLLDIALSFHTSLQVTNWLGKCKKQKHALQNKNSLLDSISNSPFAPWEDSQIPSNRPIRLTQCCTQFKSPGDKILCVLYLYYNVPFTFKWYGNSWNKRFYSQRVWIGYNIDLAE